MSGPDDRDWLEHDRRELAAALDDVRLQLEAPDAIAAGRKRRVRGARAEPAGYTTAPTALDEICDRFALSAFERDILLLAAGAELDGRFPALIAAARGGDGAPTFALALAMFAEPSWATLSPTAPLRYWRLVETGKGSTLVHSPLRIDEFILDYLTGRRDADPRLITLTESLPDPDALAPSQARLAARLARIWSEAGDALPVIQLTGADDGIATRTVAAAACRRLGLGLTAISAAALPLAADELETVLRLCERHGMLSGGAVLLSCDGPAGPAEPEPGREAAIARFVERLHAPLFIAGRKRRHAGLRSMLSFDVAKPTAAEQEAVWFEALGGEAGARAAARLLATQFHLEPGAIRTASIDARAALALDAPGTEPTLDALAAAAWDACRMQARPRLGDLAQRIEPQAQWGDLVLPEAQQDVLRAIAGQLRHRAQVHEDWGFAAQSERGLGLAVLFAGSSGTGKTMAAEVLARHLRLDLYRVDLSAVVSKYIGETEKNLRRVFDAAEEGGIILLFDEADALFGKRTEVRDSHDRHANIEVSYLLQRIETYRGLAILTTNMKEALDTAFLRRLRFIVTFPFPDPALRARIWRGVFPPHTPTQGLDMGRLAQLNVSGGQIRNVALNAAFLAAEAERPLTMADVLAAARTEYMKLEKTLTDTELKGWPA